MSKATHLGETELGTTLMFWTGWQNHPVLLLIRFGGHSTSKTPDPIPNSAVKCRRANGTAS